ncbi:MAG: pyruvate kinase [Chlorobi bacterium]|nr:pyruvate kinase [Chlorobiota bacterium]
MNRKVKTKILATVGPATDSVEALSALINAGVDAFRLNFSHGNPEYFTKLYENIEKVFAEKKIEIPIIQDLQGPKIRIGKMQEEGIEIKSGDTIEITTEDVDGTKEKISTSYKQLSKDITIGNAILINDGLIRLEVKEINDDSIICKIIEGGKLFSRKGMNLPGANISAPSLTDRDIENLEFALKHRVDYIALSYVRHPDDIFGLKQWLKAKGIEIPIIAKIEKPEGVDNFESIMKAADGIMLARGDLGVELAPQLVPIIQKNIIRRCNAVGKLVITATQMLESMVSHPVSTRAEASDIANAVFDGTDVVMLSEETSIGKYAVEAVSVMNRIVLVAESQSQFKHEIKFETPEDFLSNVLDATGRAYAKISDQMNLRAISVFTHTGREAEILAKYRPNAPIYAFSDNHKTVLKMKLYHGVYSYRLPDLRDYEIAVNGSLLTLKKEGLVQPGDLVIFVAGEPKNRNSRESWIRYLYVD